jgi:hypothetical protein
MRSLESGIKDSKALNTTTTHFNSIDLFSRVFELFSLRAKITFVRNSSSVYAQIKNNFRKDTLLIKMCVSFAHQHQGDY